MMSLLVVEVQRCNFFALAKLSWWRTAFPCLSLAGKLGRLSAGAFGLEAGILPSVVLFWHLLGREGFHLGIPLTLTLIILTSFLMVVECLVLAPVTCPP